MQIVVVRNGEVRLDIHGHVNSQGYVVETHSGYPVWDGARVKAAGVDAKALMARAKARKLTQADWQYAARMGDNGGGLVLMEHDAWYALERERTRPVREAKARRMAELFPGLDKLRAALTDEDRYHQQFNRMMEDEYNDGARPPKPVVVQYSEIAPKYPAAVAYLRAESYSLASNYAKAGAGNRALRRLEAGEPYARVISDMESEWTEAAHKAVEWS